GGRARTVPHTSPAAAALVRLRTGGVKFGKRGVGGIVSGAVAGLAAITPASGFVGPVGALVIGLARGTICYAMVISVKKHLRIDDSLDVFGVHGVGGGGQGAAYCDLRGCGAWWRRIWGGTKHL